ncbi:MAG: hypothetical protein RLZZ350_2279 [Verrucomicrobiota bacterium]|jgi:hypothetical protein
MTELTSKQLHLAAILKDKIETLQAELARVLRGGGKVGRPAAVPAATPKKKRRMTAAGRAAISAAAKARWAKVKAAKK